MKSMTGYAYREVSAENITVSVEIRSYNSRFLDLSVYLPSWLASLDPGVRKYLGTRFMRGKVDVGIRIREHNAPVSVSINENAALSYQKAITDLAKTLGIKEKPGLEMILSREGVLEAETNRNAEKYWSIIEPVLVSAADQADAERTREGDHTAEDILSHIQILEDAVDSINSQVPELEETIKENLRSRFTELLGDKIDENRIFAETALLLMKYTISEELSRLSSHLKEFRIEAESSQSPGKKLDFLSQEMGREINTIGSKTPVLTVSRKVLEMKNALENIKEQLRNVE